MYHHSNMSASSTGSYSKRLSTNNPFRPALLQEEARKSSVGTEDSSYQQWLSKQHIEEEDEDYSDYYSDNEENYRSMKAPSMKPRLYSTNSDSSMYVFPFSSHLKIFKQV
ncbi:unnamed protein product [Ambrosiozyma monospora]|uniref:Unnamed protein product n=1 Tax=Ambrosiozyma monospora TaxID=43982 RepID=A0ACB5T6L6_AMBMO|nr:unnamed protein product [Ambrosiozyma monospora]